MKKQFIAKLLVLCLVLAMIPTTVAFASATGEKNTAAKTSATYTVSLDADVSHGSVSVLVYKANSDTETLTTKAKPVSVYDVGSDTTVTIKFTADSGYKLASGAWYKVGTNGEQKSVSGDTSIKLTDNVVIHAVFESTNTTPTTPTTPSTPSTGGGGSSSTTETTKNPDGSTTTTVTKPDGTVTETTKNPDGSSSVVETKKDGTVTETVKDAEGNKTESVTKPDGTAETKVTQKDGSTSTTKVDTEGTSTSEVKLSSKAVAAATGNDPVALPMPAVSATKSTETAPTVTVSLPRGVETAKVEIPVENVNKGTVAIIVKADGTEEIVKTSVATENGVAVKLSDGATVKVVDNSKNFVDMSNHWGRDAADFASSRDLFQGTSNTTFTPDTSMTGGMFVTALARLDGVDTNGGSVWYDKGVAWAVENNISDGSNPEAPVTREQMILMIWKYAGSPASSASALSGFADASAISGNATDAMAWAVSVGLVNGVSPTSLDPQGGATRAQVATLFMRYIELIASK